ncbi:LysR substrate-binding domain-containing protein [Rhodoferax sp. TBRC 17660]|uniref:LysR substrate-binding domain-containing protein n=1 Tax=Rhodoferax potami TaxID=3068338 RepID=A0ABU3KRA6_9BURK|nr:LysR substrate-binding domain-containing protein [Rhodoferax sp. TBRC 17660]MDT7519779.1 LysR substrate-binding domain-containing protein [Rhodoferax sp. TBRC 17660]
MNLLSSLRYLVALDEHRHFARAAQACHITQPALSNALRALEEEFAVVIVRRGRTFVGFTPEGDKVLDSARRMLHEHKVLAQSLRSTVDQPAGRFVVGAVPTAVPIAARFAAMLHARHPELMPVVLSLSSSELEKRLESLSIDLALGYTERMDLRAVQLTAYPQYNEHYFLLRKSRTPHAFELQIAEPESWLQASEVSLCLLTSEMHNRTIVDASFAAAGCTPKVVMETNSILTMALSVVAGQVCSVMPGALVSTVRGYRELEAVPLVSPQVLTPISFMAQTAVRPSRAMEAALQLAQDSAWLRHVATHTGLFTAF